MKVISSERVVNKQQGVVILEALIAIFIFSIGILGLVGALSNSVVNASEAEFRTEAAFLADSLIAELRVANPTTRASNYASPSGSSFTIWKNRVTNSSTGLPGAGKAANLPTTAFSGIGNRQVTVTINWQAKSNSPTRQYVVVTALE